MASLLRIFDVHASSESALSRPADLAGFSAAIASHGLSSPLFEKILRMFEPLVAARRSVSYSALALAAADLLPRPLIDRALTDVEMDSTAIRRFLAFLRPRAPPGSATARRLEAGAEDIADQYRVALLHLLRLAVREAAAIDAAQAQAVLLSPIEDALRDEVGPEAGLTRATLVPSPFDFQRVHARAIAVRLAATHVRARALARRNRLYRLDRPSEPGAARALGSSPAVRAANVDVYLATRVGASAEECAAAARPWEVEVLSLPPLAAIDPLGAAPLSLHAWYATMATALGDISIGDATNAGGSPVPAPSAVPGELRAIIATPEAVYNDYAAHSELILSSYFSDACGMHEGSAADAGPGGAAVIGLPTLFCYEFVRNLAPLPSAAHPLANLRKRNDLHKLHPQVYCGSNPPLAIASHVRLDRREPAALSAHCG
jgi:hypothetical protein